MYLHTLSQFSIKNLNSLALYASVAYVILIMIKQTSIITFLGYKVLFIIYAGWCLILQHLDILGLILWIIYGSFIVVMFIFAFLWLETKHPTRLHKLTQQQLNALLGIIILLSIFLGNTHNLYNLNLLLNVSWLNHYELLYFQNSEEIECLGWALSADQMFPTITVSTLLTFSCLAAIVLIINAKKHKWVILKRILQLYQGNQQIITASVRQQSIFQQEARELLRLNKIFGHMKSRRA